MTRLVLVLLLATGLGGSAHLTAQSGARPGLTPVNAISGIVEALRTHDIVAVSDPHGRVQMQEFLLALLQDPRLPATVNDVVLEGASARYQDALDRFVRGDDMGEEAVRRAWEDTTQPQTTGAQTSEVIRTVRTVNRSLPPERRLRVLAGDPPIDWANITSSADHSQWIELRDTYPADLIQRRVLDRGRKALVIYGQMHSQRLQAFTNYDMTTWQSQTLISGLNRPGARLFTVWTIFEGRPLPESMASWPIPSLALLKGTDLGAADFASSAVIPNRFAVVNGVPGTVPRADWKALPFEQQFDAVLYIGPPSAMTNATIPRNLCSDAHFLQTRFERLALAGLPPIEIEQLKTGCGQ